MLDRSNGVVRVESLAVVELYTLAQLDGPSRGIGRGFPAFRKLWHQLVVVVHLGQAIAQAVAHGLHVALVIGRRIEGI